VRGIGRDEAQGGRLGEPLTMFCQDNAFVLPRRRLCFAEPAPLLSRACALA